ncbi:penicillin-binding transpeptidase domain-containing protein [Actinoplanes rectilineatus]|uniref:penicillin-binding transpeptidase domain-containing protein n=1 Tax=Actinoplanes rectilineatus TaxID=113571 RepID=UPI0005F2F3E7|nr:penicillin-binding transpeptidase domain-containing protein [Actinoplanes rectilineatus]
MSPRDDDDTPRRGTPPRRGSSRDLPDAETGEEQRPRDGQPRDGQQRDGQQRDGHSRDGQPPRDGRRGRSSISEARAYTPRGRTVAERGRLPRSGRTTDPFRPALQVLDGGEGDTAPRTRGRGRGAEPPPEEPPKQRGKRAAEPRAEQPKKAEPRSGTGGDRSASDRTRSSSARTPKEAGPRRTVTVKRGSERDGRDRDARRARPVPPEPPKLASSSRRLRLGTVLALSLFVTIGVRLVVLQLGTSEQEVAQLLDLREKRLSTVQLPAPRGSILDTNGEVLAHSVEARYVSADPENTALQKDIPGIAAQLAPLVGVAQSELAENMQRKQVLGRWLQFRYLARGVDVGVADRIEALALPGIYTHSDERRDVPGKDLAANLIGFTGDDHHGLEGLEARYDDLLHGTDGKRIFEIGKGNLNKPIPGGYEQYTAAQPGNSLKLTIDQYVQFDVQRILKKAAEKAKATVAGAVVMNAETGEVVAQASYPPYNAAKPQDFDPVERIDVPTAVVTDPGSTHKALVFGAALQEGIITPESTLAIGPAISRGGFPFEDSHPQDKGTLMTMEGLLALSSNVGTILIADQLGKEKLYEYQKLFGLGESTGEGMPGEADGELLKPEDWSGSASGSVPVGHSVSATLVQMAAAYGAIANDGVYTQPHLIKETISGVDGEVTPSAAPETHKVLDADKAAQLRTMMEAVVESDVGTGKSARVAGYRVAGKTGTGKMLVDGQYTSHYASSFVGMAPADDPKFVIAVSMDVANGSGGEVSGPAFSEMMSYTLLHYGVPPSGTKSPTFKIHP